MRSGNEDRSGTDPIGAPGRAAASRAAAPRRIGTYKVYPNPLTRVELPSPAQSGGPPLWQMLQERSSIRDYGAGELMPADLSQILWASQGITTVSP